jgi:hypothetical protein
MKKTRKSMATEGGIPNKDGSDEQWSNFMSQVMFKKLIVVKIGHTYYRCKDPDPWYAVFQSWSSEASLEWMSHGVIPIDSDKNTAVNRNAPRNTF